MIMENNILDEPELKPTVYTDASAGKRFANYIIDLIGFFAFAFIVGIILGLLGLTGLIKDINETVFGILLIFIYYNLFEMMFAQTPGKFITRTKVITEDGQRPDASVILRRSACRLIPFEAFSFLGKDRGWHDTISKTRVVNK